MNACAKKQFGGEGVVFGLVLAPRAAMQEQADRSRRLTCCIKIEPLVLRLAVGKSLGLPKLASQCCASRRVASDDLRQIGRVYDLVVAVVQLLLIHLKVD